MQREQQIGSKESFHRELVSLYRELEERIKSHSNKTRNMGNGQTKDEIEKMNQIKLQRTSVRMAIDEIEKMDERKWKSHEAEYRALVNKGRKLLDKKIL